MNNDIETWIATAMIYRYGIITSASIFTRSEISQFGGGIRSSGFGLTELRKWTWSLHSGASTSQDVTYLHIFSTDILITALLCVGVYGSGYIYNNNDGRDHIPRNKHSAVSS